MECSIQERAVALQALSLLQEPSGGSLAEKAVEAAEALKARTEEAAERARESLRGAAGTAGVGAQLATGTSKSTVAAQQAKETAAEGTRTVEQTMAQDTERVTRLYRDHKEAPQGPQPGAPQPSTQVSTLVALLQVVWRHDVPSPLEHVFHLPWLLLLAFDLGGKAWAFAEASGY